MEACPQIRMTAIWGSAWLAPPPGQTRVVGFGDDADKAAKRLPRVDRMALAVARRALGTEGVEGLGLVVGTGYGGLQATVDFLEGMATRGAAFGSPTAFHQSVHHSPAGQISLALKITGPSLTCTAREVSGEAALREGMDLINLKRCQRVLVVCADEINPAIEEAFKAFGAPWVPSEGAAALLLVPGGGDLEILDLTLTSRSAPMLGFTQPPPPGAAINPSGGLVRIAQAGERLDPRNKVSLTSHSLGGAEATVTLRRA